MLTYLSNKSQIIPLTMATRSSAKLLHSKSYAETRNHADTHTHAGWWWLYCAEIAHIWALTWSSEEKCLFSNMIRVQSHHLRLPKVTAISTRWKKMMKNCWERGEGVMPQPFFFLLAAKQFSCWSYYWHMFFSVSESTGSADLEVERA